MEIQLPLILFTFFLCLSGGILAVQGLLTYLGKSKQTVRLSLIVSAVSLVVGGIAVFTHLQHWERMFNAFGSLLAGNGTAVSGITMELWMCVITAIVLIAFFLLDNRAGEENAPKWMAIIAIVVGLVLPVVAGASYLMPSIPAWNTPMLILYYLFDTVLMGGFVVALLSGITKDTAGSSLALKIGFIGSILALIIVIAHAAIIGGFGSFSEDITYYFDPVHPQTGIIDTAAINGSIIAGSQAVLFWLGAVIVGLVVPAVLAFFGQRKDAKGTLQMAIASLVCAVIGSIVWRVILYIVAIKVFAIF